jgi:hypothetical protein
MELRSGKCLDTIRTIGTVEPTDVFVGIGQYLPNLTQPEIEQYHDLMNYMDGLVEEEWRYKQFKRHQKGKRNHHLARNMIEMMDRNKAKATLAGPNFNV